MKKLILACTLAGLFINVNAQEMWGISNSNYSGSLGLSLNPSTIVGAPYKYDINIFTMDMFIQNNLAYIPSSDKVLYNTFRGSSDAPTVVVDDYSNSKKSAFVHLQVMGPSFVWSDDKKTSWAFHTAFRTEVGVLKIPFAFNDFGVQQNIPGQNTFGVSPFSAAAMTWLEAGITYGKVSSNTGKNFFKWGITLNMLKAFDGMYVDVRHLNYTTTDSVVSTQNVNATLAHAVSNGGQGQAGNPMAFRGLGLGTTIGATYIHDRSIRAFSLKRAADDLQKYQYRFGFSLMDVGMVRFANDVGVAELNSTANASQNNINNMQFGSFQKFDTTLVGKIGGTISNKPFNIWLPMAASVQFDYALSPHWYANASLLNRMHFFANEIARGNQDVISLRYERRNFEMAFNLSLFEYSSFSSGFALRYKCFILGTDRLSQMASIQNLNAVDLYFGFKINFTDSPPKNKHAHSCPAYKSNS